VLAQMDIRQFMKRKSISDSRSAENHSNKRFQKWVLFNQHRLTREPQTWLMMVQVLFRLSCVEFMGVGRIFSKGGTTGIFYQNFSGVAKSGEICFFPIETNKTTFFGEFQNPGGLASPSDADGGFTVIKRFMHQSSKRCNGWQKVNSCGKLV